MLSLVHMSGDPDLIRGELKPAGLFLNEVHGYMSEEDKSAVRKLALEVIADYRDRGCPEPEPIGPELLLEMMQWLVREPVPPEYVPMLLEEMGARRQRQSGGPWHPCRRLPGGRDRLRGIGAAGGHSPQRGRHPVHDHREERRCGRDVVAEHLSGGAGRRRKSLLLLQLRADRSMDALSSPNSPSCRPTSKP